MVAQPSIVRILQVVDSRQFEEQGDRWVAIPGTGDERECDRCGRRHEVHATVELSDGTVAIVGTGCMRGDAMVPDLRRHASTAMSIAKAESQLLRARADLDRARVIEAECKRLPAPPITRCPMAELHPDFGRDGEFELRCGEQWLWWDPRALSEAAAVDWVTHQWRMAREQDRGMPLGRVAGAELAVERLETRLAKLKSKAAASR